MEYQALYRKYRPQRFDEVVGQDHVTRTLSREVIEGRIAHAYLFAGPRGTGKTTTARLLAKSLNCAARGDDGEPDNTCPSCVAITDGASFDVIELDAASHNKVEDIREIRVNAGTVAASSGARRVYILDEAHMLSRAAGNALLKTLEEPPEHVIFVLATTEPYKLLDTIRSRSQRFDFHPVGSETIVKHLIDISAREAFEPEPDALTMVATHATGSVRDAMSLLEQVAALGGGKVESTMVARALGLADRDAYSRLVTVIADRNAAGALGLVAELATQGADLRRFVAEGIGFMRGVFLAQYAPNLEEVADEPPDVIREWRRFADVLPAGEVLRAVDLLSDALVQLREGREERLVVELALLRLARPDVSLDAAALETRIARLEEQVRSVAAAKPIATPPAEPELEAPVAPDAPFVSDRSEAPEAEVHEGAEDSSTSMVSPAPMEPVDALDLATVEEVWPSLFATIRQHVGVSRQALLRAAAPAAVEGNTIILHVPEHQGFHLMRLQEDRELQDRLAAAAGEALGGSVEVEFRPGAVSTGLNEPARAPDKHSLTESGTGADQDPTELIKDMLGGEIIAE